MSVVDGAIRAARAERGGALIGYLPAGYPDVATSIEAAVALAENGVDVIELGVPYSDPVMDGAVIQAATQQALAAGFTLRDLFTVVRGITSRTTVPVLVMTYVNPVFQYGVQRFAADLAAAGGAGLITPDLIPDEASEWLAASEESGLDRVFLAAPTSSEARLDAAIAHSRGFVYAVSTMGTTGAREDVDAAAEVLVGRLKKRSEEALVCVGIGLSTGEQVRQVLGYADGAIVGTALVAALRDGGVEGVAAKARELASGVGPR